MKRAWRAQFLSHDLQILWKFITFKDLQMIEKSYLAKSNGINFRNFGHKQGIQVHKRNPCLRALYRNPCIYQSWRLATTNWAKLGRILNPTLRGQQTQKVAWYSHLTSLQSIKKNQENFRLRLNFAVFISAPGVKESQRNWVFGRFFM